MSEGIAPQEAAQAPVLERLRAALPDLEWGFVPTPNDPAIVVRREDLPRLMPTLKEHPDLAFDYLRCLSGVDHIDQLEVVYHLRSFRHGHTLCVKVPLPVDDPRLPTVSHLWQAANWHERETHEMFGIVFEGHPDLRPLLLEEGLGYHPLRKSHPLAEIEEWQEEMLEREERLVAAAAPPGAQAEEDERAKKVALAQKKAEVMKKARQEARAKGLSGEEERQYVREAVRRFEEEMAQQAAPKEAPAKAPAADRAAKVALAQKKAEAIRRAREEARAQGLSGEEERKYIQEALRRLEQEGG